MGEIMKNIKIIDKIDISINGIVYSRITNSSGEAKLNINLNPGKYEVTSTKGKYTYIKVLNKRTGLTENVGFDSTEFKK